MTTVHPPLPPPLAPVVALPPTATEEPLPGEIEAEVPLGPALVEPDKAAGPPLCVLAVVLVAEAEVEAPEAETPVFEAPVRPPALAPTTLQGRPPLSIVTRLPFAPEDTVTRGPFPPAATVVLLLAAAGTAPARSTIPAIATACIARNGMGDLLSLRRLAVRRCAGLGGAGCGADGDADTRGSGFGGAVALVLAEPETPVAASPAAPIALAAIATETRETRSGILFSLDENAHAAAPLRSNPKREPLPTGRAACVKKRGERGGGGSAVGGVKSREGVGAGAQLGLTELVERCCDRVEIIVHVA